MNNIIQLNFTEETLKTKMVIISDILFTERSVTRAYVETIILFSMKVDTYCKKRIFYWYETEMLLDIVVNILEYHNYNVPYVFYYKKISNFTSFYLFFILPVISEVI